MARFNAALEKGLSAHNEELYGSSKLKRLGAKAVAVMGISTVAVFGIGAANADPGVNIEVGGATDSQSAYIHDELHQNGSVLPGEVAVPIHYPAEMGPFVGQTPTNISNEIGVNAVKQAVHDALANNPGQPITLWGFSQGAMVTDAAATQLRAEGINVAVKNSGDGMGAAGVTNSEIAKTFSPIVTSLGIPIGEVHPVAGTVEKLDANDVWASNQAGDIGKILNNALNMGSHRIIGANEVPSQVFNVDGVTYEVYNGTVPLPPGAVDGPAGPVEHRVAPVESPVPPSPQAQPEYVQPRPAPVVTPSQEQAMRSMPNIEDVPAPVAGQPLTADQQAVIDGWTAAMGGLA